MATHSSVLAWEATWTEEQVAVHGLCLWDSKSQTGLSN